MPGDLAQEIARLTSVAQGVWAEARAADDVAAFLPTLSQVIDLKRQEAAALAQGGDLYDALIDDYEPGATAAILGAMFDRMRPRLVDLRAAVLAAAAPAPLHGHFGVGGAVAPCPRSGLDLRLRLGPRQARHGGASVLLVVGGNDCRITTRRRRDRAVQLHLFHHPRGRPFRL